MWAAKPLRVGPPACLHGRLDLLTMPLRKQAQRVEEGRISCSAAPIGFSTTHVGSLIRPELDQAAPARQTEGRGLRRRGACPQPHRDRGRGGASAGRGRGRRRQRRRVRQGHQLVAVRVRADERLREAPVHADDWKSVHARRRPRSGSPSSTQELDARDHVETITDTIAVAPIRYTGQALLQRDIDNFKAALEVREGDGGLSAGRGAGLRDPRPQERVLQDRGGTGGSHRPGDARRVQADRRQWPARADRRRARRGHLRPHGAAGELQGLPQVGRAPHGRAERARPRASRPRKSATTCAGAAGPARTPPTSPRATSWT